MRHVSQFIVICSSGSVNVQPRHVPYIGRSAAYVLVPHAGRVMRCSLSVARPASEVRNRRPLAIDAEALKPTLLAHRVAWSKTVPFSTEMTRCRNKRADLAHCRPDNAEATNRGSWIEHDSRACARERKRQCGRCRAVAMVRRFARRAANPLVSQRARMAGECRPSSRRHWHAVRSGDADRQGKRREQRHAPHRRGVDVRRIGKKDSSREVTESRSCQRIISLGICIIRVCLHMGRSCATTRTAVREARDAASGHSRGNP